MSCARCEEMRRRAIETWKKFTRAASAQSQRSDDEQRHSVVDHRLDTRINRDRRHRV